jgi:hypothetical protein
MSSPSIPLFSPHGERSRVQRPRLKAQIPLDRHHKYAILTAICIDCRCLGTQPALRPRTRVYARALGTLTATAEHTLGSWGERRLWSPLRGWLGRLFSF